MSGTKFERSHIVDFAEEAVLQLKISLDNSAIQETVNELCTLITTTEEHDWVNHYERAEILIRALGVYRDPSKIYFVPSN